MAPGHGRQRLRTPATPTCAPTRSDSSPSMPSSTTSVASSSSRRGRGLTRGVGLERIVYKAGRLHVDIPRDKGSPVRENAEKFVSELGFIVRNFAPLQVRGWIEIMKEDKNPLYDRILTKFDIDLNEPHVKLCCERVMQKAYRDFRHTLHRHYKKFDTPNVAWHTPYTNVRQDDWIFLCNLLEKEKFQQRSAINSTN